MGRREGPSEERRQAIIDAAETVFGTAGYSGASIRAIARQAGVSSALLYWFFPNKAQLFGAVLTRRAEALGITRFPAEMMDVPPDVLLPQLAQGFAHLLLQPDQVRLMRLLLHEQEAAADAFAALRELVMGRLLGPLAAYCAAQIRAGRLRPLPPEYLAQVFISLFLGLVLRRELLQEPTSREWPISDYIKTAVEVLLHGLLTDEAAPPSGAPTSVPTPIPVRRAAHITPDGDAGDGQSG